MNDEKKKLGEKEDRSDSRRRNEYYGGTYPERAKRNLMSGPQPVHAPQKPEDLHPFLGDREEPEDLSVMIDVYAGPEPDPPCPVYAGPEPDPEPEVTSVIGRWKSRLIKHSDADAGGVYAGPEMLSSNAPAVEDASMLGMDSELQTCLVYAGPDYFSGGENVRTVDAEDNGGFITVPEEGPCGDSEGILCPACGGTIPANGKFCPCCGSPAPKREE